MPSERKLISAVCSTEGVYVAYQAPQDHDMLCCSGDTLCPSAREGAVERRYTDTESSLSRAIPPWTLIEYMRESVASVRSEIDGVSTTGRDRLEWCGFPSR